MAEVLIGSIFHARSQPRRNAFKYSAYYIFVTVTDSMIGVPNALLSIDRFNLFSLYRKDYAAGDAPLSWVRSVLARAGVCEADGEVKLLTLPRVLGYAFNPVSFWLCFDRKSGLRAVIAEVNNTFGERHSYLCAHPDHRVIAPDEWLETEKVFYVSPFLKVEGHYRFRFACDETSVGIWINHFGREGLRLSTSLVGKRRPLTATQLLICFFRYPLVTLKVIALIHYQAGRLLIKRIRRQEKPEPPIRDLT